MKKVISTVLSMALLLGTVNVMPAFAEKGQAEAKIKFGDYVQMGKYYDEPILWRSVGYGSYANDGGNNRLFMSDKILTIKPYDVKGEHKYAVGRSQADRDDYRKNTGSSVWESSNLRCWLNSAASAGDVEWLDGCPPTDENVADSMNGYADEKGFLGDGNFNEQERNAILEVTQKTLLSPIDAQIADLGYEHRIGGNTVSTTYYQNVTDKIFLLDEDQMNTVHSKDLGGRYYIGQPTQKAVENSDYKNSAVLAEGKEWGSWLRSPSKNFQQSHEVLYVSSMGGIKECNANQSNVGVRPAFYMDLSAVKFISGDGSKESPYIVDNGMTEENQNVEETPVGTAAPVIDETTENTSAEAPNSTEVYFQGKKIALTLPIQEVDGRTMYPLRECLEAMGAKVTWEESTNTAYGELNRNKVGFQIGQKTYTVNGETKEMDVAPYLDEASGRTYIPLRFAAEGLGKNVRWDDTTKNIFIEERTPISVLSDTLDINKLESRPFSERQEWVNANWNLTCQVSLKDGKLYVNKAGKEPSNLYLVENGYLVGEDRGEFGGNITFHSGTESYEILGENFRGFVKINNDIYVLTGLAHLGSFHGALYKLKMQDNKWIAEKTLDLGNCPETYVLTDDNTLYVVTYQSLVEIKNDAITKILTPDAFEDGLSTNSAVYYNNMLVIGLRAGIYTYQLDSGAENWYPIEELAPIQSLLNANNLDG